MLSEEMVRVEMACNRKCIDWTACKCVSLGNRYMLANLVSFVDENLQKSVCDVANWLRSVETTEVGESALIAPVESETSQWSHLSRRSFADDCERDQPCAAMRGGASAVGIFSHFDSLKDCSRSSSSSVRLSVGAIKSATLCLSETAGIKATSMAWNIPSMEDAPVPIGVVIAE